jgi:anti-sigma B factor antagonist
MENISISLSESGPGKAISEVRVDGVIDTITASEFEEVLDTLVRRGRYRLIVDLAGVDYISSAGWGIFISHIKDVRNNNGDIKLANMIPNVHEIYELLEFDNVLKAYRSLDEARMDFAGGSQEQPPSVRPDSPTRVKVVEPRLTSPQVTSPTPADSAVASDPVTKVLALVKEDPFYSISEIRAELTRRDRFRKVGWWQIFGILRRHKLLKKRSRFRFSQGRR